MSTGCLRGTAARPCECPARCAGPGGAAQRRPCRAGEHPPAGTPPASEARADRQLPGEELLRGDALAARHATASLPLHAPRAQFEVAAGAARSEAHTSELQSLMRTSYAVF